MSLAGFALGASFLFSLQKKKKKNHVDTLTDIYLQVRLCNLGIFFFMKQNISA